MKGKAKKIEAGLKFFKAKCQVEPEEIEVEIQRRGEIKEEDALLDVISQSFSSLKVFSITARNNSGYIGGTMAHLSQNLEVLRSIESDPISFYSHKQRTGSDNFAIKTFLSSKLRVLVWKRGEHDLDYDDAILTFLKSAKVVEINSNQLSEHWAWDLITSNSNLQKVKFSQCAPRGGLLRLPKSGGFCSLKDLDIPRLPAQFTRIKTPNLQ